MDDLTTVQCPIAPRPTPLRVKVAEVVGWSAFWALFTYTIIH